MRSRDQIEERLREAQEAGDNAMGLFLPELEALLLRIEDLESALRRAIEFMGESASVRAYLEATLGE